MWTRSSFQSTRLIWAVIATIVVAAVTTIYTVWRLDRVKANLELINQVYVPVLKHLNSLDGKWSAYQKNYEQVVSFRKWGNQHSDRSVPKLHLRKMVEGSLKEVSRLLERMQWTLSQPETSTQIKVLMEQISALADREPFDMAEIASLVKIKHYDEAAKIYSHARQSHLAISQSLTSVSHDVEDQVRLLQFSTDEELRNFEAVFTILLLASLLLSVFILFRLRQWLVPVMNLTKVSQEISLKGIQGSVEFPIVNRNMPDEVQLLTREFSRMGMTVLERERTIVQQKSKLEGLNQSLKDQNEMLRKLGGLNERILNSMTSGLLVISTAKSGNHVVEQANEQYCELFGGTRNELLGADASQVLSHWRLFVAPDSKMLGSWPNIVECWLNTSENLEMRRLQLYGRIFNVRCHQLSTHQGRLLLFEDVTHIVAAEAKLEHARKLVLAGNMSSQVAHEVRNPLNSMSIQLEMLEEDLASQDSLRAKVSAISEQVQRLERITERYLEVRSLDRAQRNQIRKTVDLHQIIEKCIEFLASELQAAQIVVNLDCLAKQTHIFADADALSQVIFNLIRNSIEALQDQDEVKARWIKISTRDSAALGCALVRVTDSGPGIKQELASRIFEPFVTDKVTGHGLGLSVSRQICIEHGGELKYLAEEALRDGEIGATFEFSVPTQNIC